jgi:polysaccharide export outer membrane protein
VILLSACSPSRKQILFQDIPNDTTLTNLVSKNFEPKIQNGDVLGISVASLSPENTMIYNVPPNMVGGKLGYLVDANGTIEFIKLGRIHAAGLTQRELKNQLEKNLQPYLSQNIVSVGFLNRHVTLIGASQKIIPLEDDNMTILDALTAGGNNEGLMNTNILVIRENGINRDFKRINLTDKSIFYSPYFYLQPNDIIYIESNKTKVNNTIQIISYVTTGITFIIFLMDRIFR